MRLKIIAPNSLLSMVLDREVTEQQVEAIKALLNHDAAQLVGCEEGGDHTPTSNEHGDAWCSRCGERLLLTGFAGGPYVAAYDAPVGAGESVEAFRG